MPGAGNLPNVGPQGPQVSMSTPTTNIQDALRNRNMIIRAQSMANQPGNMTSQGITSQQGIPVSQQQGIMTSQQQPTHNQVLYTRTTYVVMCDKILLCTTHCLLLVKTLGFFLILY